MRNRFFQWLWYAVIKWLITLTKEDIDNPVDHYYNRFIGQYQLALLFGGAKTIYFGDSNCEVSANLNAMQKFSKLTLNFGKGGSTAGNWVNFFQTKNGKKLYELIKDKTIIINLPGNNVLQKQMDSVVTDMQALIALFPSAWWCTIPPIRSWMFQAIDKQEDPEYWDRSVIACNRIIKTLAGLRYIDIYQALKDAPQAIYEISLSDAVHFSYFAVGCIIRVIKHI
jgi:hypothetical protein